ncbi:UPF0598 protein CG30010 [Cylas formicarius]|uniref:UPF0598 protein CG30010 n=1 Tax=Cylas formicarius TaxID=197179 RepID=UPI00295845B3|nr:UPF0598 protein CG30010 [Cylas formicarius]
MLLFVCNKSFVRSKTMSAVVRVARNKLLLYRSLHYVQGQEPEPKVREYFYYIDHQGMLFLDDARMKNFTSCFKDKSFLRFFFRRLRLNGTGRYTEFPYLSVCGKERNFVRCDDYPVVYTHVIRKNGEYLLAHNHADDLLTVEFRPDKLLMLPTTGRVYHPAPPEVGSVGLIRSKLAVEFSSHFEFGDRPGDPPTHFNFDGHRYLLEGQWYKEVMDRKSG